MTKLDAAVEDWLPPAMLREAYMSDRLAPRARDHYASPSPLYIELILNSLGYHSSFHIVTAKPSSNLR